jgi:hypothetical protein
MYQILPLAAVFLLFLGTMTYVSVQGGKNASSKTGIDK